MVPVRPSLLSRAMRAFGIDEPLDVGMPRFKTANGGDVGVRGIASLQVSMLVSERETRVAASLEKGQDACFGW